MTEAAKSLEKEIARMFNRGSIEGLWQTLALNFYPERASFTSSISLGEEFSSHLYDSTPVRLRRDLGNAFEAMLRPRGQEWMRASTADAESLTDQRAAHVFFQHVTRRVRAALYDPRSKFVRAAKECDHDYATFGAAVMSIEMNPTQSGLAFRSYHLKDCAWAENHEGTIDKFVLRGEMTARQMRQKFRGAHDSLHEKVEKAYEKNPDTPFRVAHYTVPVGEYTFESDRRRPKSAPFASVWIDRSNCHIMREGVSFEFRYVVPRWQMLAGSVYPVSPAAMTALPDARMLQSMARVIIEASEKVVDPPLVGTADAVIGDVNLAASGITWVDREYDERFGASLRPLDLGKNLPAGFDMLISTREQVADAMYISKLNLPERGERTAYEMARRVEEYIRAATPLFEPLETEYISPVLDLAASILLRSNAIDLSLMPEELDDRAVAWHFQNPLQDALEKQKILAAQTVLDMQQGFVAFDPKTLANLDMHRMQRDTVIATGAPAEWLRDEKEVEKDLKEAAEVERTSQMMDTLARGGEAAQAVGDGAQSLGTLQ